MNKYCRKLKMLVVFFFFFSSRTWLFPSLPSIIKSFIPGTSSSPQSLPPQRQQPAVFQTPSPISSNYSVAQPSVPLTSQTKSKVLDDDEDLFRSMSTTPKKESIPPEKDKKAEAPQVNFWHKTKKHMLDFLILII